MLCSFRTRTCILEILTPKIVQRQTHLLSLHYTLGSSPNIAYMSVVVCAANLTRSVLGYCNHRVGVGRFKIVVDLRADTNNNNAHYTIGVAVTIGILTMWLTN